MPVPPLCPLSIFSRCTSSIQFWKTNLVKLTPQLTVKACFPSSIGRQNVRLVLKVINDLTLSPLEIQSVRRYEEYRHNTSTIAFYILRQCHSTLNRHHGWQLPWDKYQILVFTAFKYYYKALQSNIHGF